MTRPLPKMQQPGNQPRRPAVRFFTVPEVAKYLRVSKMTVYRMVHGVDGKQPILPSYRVGRSIRVPAIAVMKYLDGHRWNGTWDTKDNQLISPTELGIGPVQLELF
jgi:excisionase family DNA binding protein